MSRRENIHLKSGISPLKPSREKLLILNQLLLPHETSWVECTSAEEVAASIKKMHVRGAPAIGVTAAFGYYLGVWSLVSSGKIPTEKQLSRLKMKLDSARPTAVNLMWATAIMLEVAQNWLNARGIKEKRRDIMQLLLLLYSKANELADDDASRCLSMSNNAADYLMKHYPGSRYRALTHCNTGALATCGIGTALGMLRVLHYRKKIELVYADETRPYLQGGRLTAFELKKEKIPARLVVDSMAAFLMQKKEIDFVVVGADRIAANGDVANKIGTYNLSVLCKEHNIPFFVVAPLSTFDKTTATGKDIQIEERNAAEVTHVGQQRVSAQVPVLNYSFDITPRKFITAIFHEKGIY